MRACIALLLLAGLPAAIGAQELRGLAAARQRAAGDGRVRIIVGLRLTGAPAISDRAQRSKVAQVQSTLLADVAAEAADVTTFSTVPYVAMTVPAHLLDAIAARADVESIRLSRTNVAHLRNSTVEIGAPAAWDQGFTGIGWGVAILDDGVDRNHPHFRVLQSRVVSEACYSGGGNSLNSLCPGATTASFGAGAAAPCVTCDHGTHVAGIAAGNLGVANAAHIVAIQVFSRAANGSIEAFDDDIIQALERVYELRSSLSIAAVNMSLGSGRYFSSCDGESPAMKAVIDRLRAAGIATVISTGNSGWRDSMSFPACISSAISVGNADMYTSGGSVAAGSNIPTFTALVAPGTNIESARAGGGTVIFSGTSMAAPHVAGSWAIMKQRRPAASVDQVLSVLWQSSINHLIPDSLAAPIRYFRRPRLDVALELWADPPGSTALIAPRATSESPTPAFSWHRAAGATQYIVRVYDDNGMYQGRSVTAAEAGCSAAAQTQCSTSLVQPLTGGAKTWWVLPLNLAGSGKWSEGFAFTVFKTPGKATLVAPGGALGTSRPTYSWQPVAGVTWYGLYVNDVTGNRIHLWYTPFQAGCEFNTGTCSVTPPTRLTSGEGRWWVQTYNEAGYGEWSAGMSFNFDKPAEVIHIFPLQIAGDGSGVTVRVTLSAEVRNTSAAPFPAGYALWFKVIMPGGSSRWLGPAPVSALGGSTSGWYSVDATLPSGGPYTFLAAVWLGNTLVSRETAGPTVTLPTIQF
jgi:subtilisin family serine protease